MNSQEILKMFPGYSILKLGPGEHKITRNSYSKSSASQLIDQLYRISFGSLLKRYTSITEIRELIKNKRLRNRYLRLWESGEVMPGEKNMQRIVKILCNYDIDAKYLTDLHRACIIRFGWWHFPANCLQSIDKEKFSKALLKIMFDKNLSVNSIKNSLGISKRSTIRSWLLCRSFPSPENFQGLVLLGLKYSWSPDND